MFQMEPMLPSTTQCQVQPGEPAALGTVRRRQETPQLYEGHLWKVPVDGDSEHVCSRSRNHSVPATCSRSLAPVTLSPHWDPKTEGGCWQGHSECLGVQGETHADAVKVGRGTGPLWSGAKDTGAQDPGQWERVLFCGEFAVGHGLPAAHQDRKQISPTLTPLI